MFGEDEGHLIFSSTRGVGFRNDIPVEIELTRYTDDSVAEVLILKFVVP